MSARENELQFLATLHRGPAIRKLSEAELDAQIAERPTTERFSRGLGEKQQDPMAWWTTAEAAAAEEEWIREQFRSKEPVHSVWAHRIVFVLFVAMLLCVCVRGWNWWLPGGGA